jgi:hypothetical protein
MQSRLLADGNGLRTFVLVMETGDEAMSCIRAFANQEHLAAAQFSGIGAFSRATLNYFDWERKEYRGNPVNEQVEVASLIGDVAIAPDGSRTVHAHIVLGRRDGSALAGHLAEGHVRPTLEIILTEAPVHLRKVYDAESRLALIRPDA